MVKAQRLKGGRRQRGSEQTNQLEAGHGADSQGDCQSADRTILFAFLFLLTAMMHISFPLLFSLWFTYKKRRNLSMKEELLFPSSATSARSWI